MWLMQRTKPTLRGWKPWNGKEKRELTRLLSEAKNKRRICIQVLKCTIMLWKYTVQDVLLPRIKSLIFWQNLIMYHHYHVQSTVLKVYHAPVKLSFSWKLPQTLWTVIVSIVLYPFLQEVAGVRPAEQGDDGHCWQERGDHPETSGKYNQPTYIAGWIGLMLLVWGG